MDKQIDYDSVTNVLFQHSVNTDAAEVHGIMCGMLCGGMSLTDQKWQTVMADTTNQGEPFPQPVTFKLEMLYTQTCEQLLEGEFSLQMMLPDEQAPINDRGLALRNWVQGFMLGFGLHQQDLMQCSADIKEALQDFSDISRMEEPMEEDDDSERALNEVLEYVKISALLCFSELGRSLLEDQQDKPSVH